MPSLKLNIKDMKYKIFIILTTISLNLISIKGQTQPEIFKGKLYNKEYKVSIILNFHNPTIKIPGQEDIFGELAGYLTHESDPRLWLILDATTKGNTASLSIINDYGSEDLQATLTAITDSTYTFVQKEGSTIKFAVNRKWQKLPKQLIFHKMH